MVGVLEPLTHSRADLRISKDSLVLNHVLTVEYSSFCLMANLFARFSLERDIVPSMVFSKAISKINVAFMLLFLSKCIFYFSLFAIAYTWSFLVRELYSRSSFIIVVISSVFLLLLLLFYIFLIFVLSLSFAIVCVRCS